MIVLVERESVKSGMELVQIIQNVISLSRDESNDKSELLEEAKTTKKYKTKNFYTKISKHKLSDLGL